MTPPAPGPAAPGSGRGAPPREILFYDGQCGLCHRAVRFVLRHDRDGSRFAFAPQQGASFAPFASGTPQSVTPNSLVVRRADGVLLVRSAAVLHILRRLGGLWRVLAAAGGLLPRPLRDGLYRLVARVRRRLFAAPAGLCPVVPPEWRARFLP